jgi:DNA polymerase-4
LTASAGVAPSKFLAKIASDSKKPDGLFVIQPQEVDSFLLPLPVGRLPGVGKVTEEKLKSLDVQTVADLRKMDLAMLERRFGRYGVRLYELARGIDKSEVVPDRPTQYISAEDTFEQDVPLAETEAMIRRLAEKTWIVSRQESRIARTVVLNKHCPVTARTRGTWVTAAVSPCWRWSQHFLRVGRGICPTGPFRIVGSRYRDRSVGIPDCQSLGRNSHDQRPNN